MALGGLLRKWGLGVVLGFDGGDSTVKMGRTAAAATMMKRSFEAVKSAGEGMTSGLTQMGAVLAPIAAGFAVMIHKASALAAELEAQKLTMRVLIGSASEADRLMGMIRANAAATPFQEGDLIEGSKRLLKLTGSNVDKNMELLKTMELLTALNPGKTVVDSVEALLDASNGGGFERMKELNIGMSAAQFSSAGPAGSKAWADAVYKSLVDTLKQATHGEDLVAALGDTFMGRASTLADSFTNMLKEVGDVVNTRIGPMLGDVTSFVTNGIAPAVKAGALSVAASIDRMATAAQPMIKQLKELWISLGDEGRAKLATLALGFGALITVILPIGGILGAAGVAIGGLVTAVSSVAALFAPEVLGGIVLTFGQIGAAAAAAAGLFFAVFRNEGEGPIAFIMRMGRAIYAYLQTGFERTKTIVGALWSGFSATFGGFDGLIAGVRGPVSYLVDRFSKLVDMISGGDVNTDAWRMFGEFLGGVVNTGLNLVTSGIELVISLFDILFTTFQPIQAVLFKLIEGFVGLVSGSMSAGDAVRMMAGAMLGVISALFNAILGLAFGALELLLRTFIVSIAAIPGADKLLASTGNLGADKLALTRRSLSDTITDSISAIDGQAAGTAKAKADSNAPTVNVHPATVQTAVKVDAKLNVDGKEVARATGAQASKAGQKSGRELPAPARARVIRGNGSITALGALESF